MEQPPHRSDEDLSSAVMTYADTLYRIALTMLRNPFDAEDVVQDTFLAYYRCDKTFSSSEHQKAWLITVTVNRCKNRLGFLRRHPPVNWDDLRDVLAAPDDTTASAEHDILDALLRLPVKYRIVMTLHYVEEYKVREVAEILGVKESTVKMRLQKGRQLLKNLYRKEYLP